MSSKPTIITDAARANATISGSTIVGINALYISLTTVFVFLRMYTRFSVHQKLWWDDCMCPVRARSSPDCYL